MERKRIRKEGDSETQTQSAMNEPVATLLRNQEQTIQYICTVGQLCETMTRNVERLSMQMGLMEERLRKMEENLRREEEIARLQQENGDLKAQLAFCEEEIQKKYERRASCDDFV